MIASTAMSDVSIAWAELGQVIGVSLVVAVGLVALFAVGVRILAFGNSSSGSRTPTKTRMALASVLFLICGVVGVYGIYLLIKK